MAKKDIFDKKITDNFNLDDYRQVNLDEICGFCFKNIFSKTIQINDIFVKKCLNCGVIKQCVNMTYDDYINWYQNYDNFIKKRGDIPYFDRYEHDHMIAQIRWKRHKRILGEEPPYPVLDIGCANGANIDFLNSIDIFAVGIDIRKIYTGKSPFYFCNLENLKELKKFVSEMKKDLNLKKFKTIILYDVFEHLSYPFIFMNNLKKILEPESYIIIDVPDFFHKKAKHHWRKIEHLYYFDEAFLNKFFHELNYKLIKIDKPIEGKSVYYLKY
ncbi:MAG: class I SAM-dependent methyltransferase [Candidatus Dojkabacteria bacterium]|nr:class I SAM-dependent methyltransferase [Candidatus Dojkabacteria bacterium]